MGGKKSAARRAYVTGRAVGFQRRRLRAGAVGSAGSRVCGSMAAVTRPFANRRVRLEPPRARPGPMPAFTHACWRSSRRLLSVRDAS
ncbi:hypothetical protein EVAR_14842_1 [Eumeta japonica]|uniref:Uncharacterized protein n=1 Tax=Eumeta variegata TaxID=151549 RepID=A0A4C1V301_EUMVA|nr:hypothetical protein EVAR_14842_1 [Eumeta japonica]